MSFEEKYPHCDDLVLHAPGTCMFCDHYPERQQRRIDQGINFTGGEDRSLTPCPSEMRRPLETINRWPGNRPEVTSWNSGLKEYAMEPKVHEVRVHFADGDMYIMSFDDAKKAHEKADYIRLWGLVSHVSDSRTTEYFPASSVFEIEVEEDVQPDDQEEEYPIWVCET